MDFAIGALVGLIVGGLSVFAWLNMPLVAGGLIRIRGVVPQEFYYLATFKAQSDAQAFYAYLTGMGLTALVGSNHLSAPEVSWSIVCQPIPVEIRRHRTSFEAVAEKLQGKLLIAATSFTNYNFITKRSNL